MLQKQRVSKFPANGAEMDKMTNKRRTYIKPLAAFVTATLSTWASAQGAENIQELSVTKAKTQSEQSYKVEKSSSIKNTQPLVDTAKSITVINKAVMKDRNVDSLQDALRNVSGISLAAGEGGAPAGDSLSIRGFSAANDIFIDGIRDIAGYDRDTYNVEQIEVAKGPSSATTGRGSTGGSINLTTKTATLDEFNDASLRLGTESDYRAQIDSNFKVAETSALRVNLLVDKGDVAGRDHVEKEKQAVAVSFATGLGTNSRFNLNADYQNQDNMSDYGIPWVGSSPVAELAGSENAAPPVNFTNFYGNVYRDFEDIEAYSTTAKYEYDLSQTTTLRAQGRIGRVERKDTVTAPRFIDVKTTTDIRMSDVKNRDTRNELATLQLDLVGEYYFAGVKHNVVTGVELTNETFSRWNVTALVADNLKNEPALNDLYNPDAYLPYTGQYGRDGTSTEAVAKTRAIYAFDTITFNEYWQLTAGLRSEQYDSDYQYDYKDPALTISTSDTMTSWNASAVYKPSQNSSIYFGAGNSYNPSAEGIAVSTRGNSSELDPEKSQSYELGTKWNLLDDKLMTSAAIFRTVKTNARVDDPNSDQRGVEVLDGEQRVQGLELSATGIITDELSIIGSYSYQDSEVTESTVDGDVGHNLARAPKNSYSVWARYDFSDAIAAGFGAQYIGERYNGNSATSRKADSYVLFDMMLSYQATEQLSIQFNGENLTDEDYEDKLGGGHFIPGQGRYFTLTASYSF